MSAFASGFMRAFVLVLNCGSSSIKFALFDAGMRPLARKPLWNGKVDGITGPAPTYGASDAKPAPIVLDAAKPYAAALRHIHQQVQAQLQAHGASLKAVAHRVVHGGSKYFEPVRVDAAVLADLQGYIPLAPLHQPFALEAIGALLRELPGVAQVACFDTAFHHTLPLVEQIMPLPWSAWERGLRRYGFHGLSYDYIATALAERHGDRARGRTLVAHIGSGASLCAMQNLQSQATTMGFSALDGLMMSTRCGAVDPGAILYLMEVERLSLEQVGHLLYHESGLLGVSGLSSDVRVLLQHEAEHERASIALALYVRRMAREAGALTAALGGLDMLVFTAGVGEHSAAIRERVCRQLGYLGIELDGPANERHERVISTPDSRVVVLVEPTNEEWVAATRSLELLAPEAPS